VTSTILSTPRRAALAVALALLTAAPAAADAVRWSHPDSTASARLASGPSTWVAGSNIKRTSGLALESWWGNDSSWNRYAYVENNPVNATDPTGELANWAAGALIGAAIGAGGELARQYFAGEDLSLRDIGAAAAGGLVSGAIAGGTFGASLIAQAGVRGAAVAGAVANAAGGAVQRELDSSRETQALSASLFVDIAVGGMGGAIGHTAQAAREAAHSPRIGSLQKNIARRSEIVGRRMARGGPPMSAGAKLLRDQAQLAGEQAAAETLGTVVGTVTTNALAPMIVQHTGQQLE
jgi:hypothetical protein